jgi:hypothetical protein
MRQPFFCIVALFGVLSSANADTVTFDFTGSVTQVPLDDVFGDIAVGSAIQGSYTFDTTAVDLVPADPNTGSYTWSAPFGMLVTVEAHDFSTSGVLNIGVVNSFVDQYTVFALSATGDLTLELFLQDTTGSVFVNDHLPLLAPSLSSLTQKDFHFHGMFAGGEVQFDGQLSAPSVQAVPEPSPAIPLLVGSIMVMLARRRLS